MKKATLESVKISTYIQKFLTKEVPLVKTESWNTLKSLKETLYLYIKFLEESENISPSQLSGECFKAQKIKDWLYWLHNVRGCSAASCNTRLAGIRSFLKYLSGEDIEYLNLFLASTSVTRLKGPKKKVESLSRSALKAIFDAPDLQTKTGRRDIVLLVFLYSTAGRINEVLDLRLNQLNLKSGKPFVRFIGKGNKLRTIYLLPEVVNLLLQYLKEFHEDQPDPNAVLFYSSHKDKYTPITQTAVNRMLKKYASKVHDLCEDVPLNLHAHQFRHARASHWLEEGLNIVQISLLLGHQNINTTMVYLDVTLDQKFKALSNLESNKQKQLVPKWKDPESLAEFCGFKR